jgi:hypothetical protein
MGACDEEAWNQRRHHAVPPSPKVRKTRNVSRKASLFAGLGVAVGRPLQLGAKPYPIAAANRPTPHDRRIHPHLALMMLNRRAQNLTILRERFLG